MNKQLLTEIQNSVKTTVFDNKIGVAFSGGVDSTLIAKLLKDMGYDIHLLTVGFHDSHDINFALQVNEVLDYPHNILEIDPNSTDDEVKKAYRKMAIKYHPDKVSHLGDELKNIAEEKFKSVNDAYQSIKKERKI